jgi:hypothetical protein
MWVVCTRVCVMAQEHMKEADKTKGEAERELRNF